MALDLTPEQKEIGRQNFHRVVGKLGQDGVDPGRRDAPRLHAGPARRRRRRAHRRAAYFGYTNSTFRERPVKAGLIGAGDEGGVLVGEHNPAYVEFVAFSDIRPTNQDRIFEDERQRNPNSPRRGFNYHYGNDARASIRLYDRLRGAARQPRHRGGRHRLAAAPARQGRRSTRMQAGKHVLCEKLMAWNITPVQGDDPGRRRDRASSCRSATSGTTACSTPTPTR